MKLASGMPIFEALADYYRSLIRRGAFAPGDALPSVREVAMAERINPNTVARAFSLLCEEGTVVSVPKKGYFVAEKERESNPLHDALSHLLESGYSKEDIIQELQQLKGGAHDQHQ